MKIHLGIAAILVLSCAAVASAGREDHPSGGGPLPGSDEIILTFRGQVDGSERIEVSQSHAYWLHGEWSWPEGAVTLNGVRWDPRSRRSLDNEGETRFLPREVDFRTARLKTIQGRDTVVLEPRRRSVLISITDTPNGASTYEFQVAFRPRPRVASLRVVAEIDGSDQLHLDASGARWVHKEWDCPREVRMNEVRWYPQDPPFLKNEGRTAFLAGPVDFATAKLTVNAGRDTAVLEHTERGLIVHLADNPLGHATYDLTITFDE